MKKIFTVIFIGIISMAVFAQETANILTRQKVDELCAVTGMTRNTITEFTVPSEYTIIGDNAFEECRQLRKVNLHSGITEIGEFAFGKTAIDDFTLPAGIISIGKYAFGKCGNLATLTILSKSPPKIYPSVKGAHDEFYTGNLNKKITIYVPDEFVEAYRTKWREETASYFYIQPISSKETSEKNPPIASTNKENKAVASETIENKTDDTTKTDTSSEELTTSDTVIGLIFFALLILCIILLIRLIKKLIKQLKNGNEQTTFHISMK